MGKNKKTGYAHFRSDILWQCQPFVDYQRDMEFPNLWNGNIIIEPHPEGGALVVAATPHAMGIFHDPDGSCTAPMTVNVPDNIFAACEPLKNIHFSLCGDEMPMLLPEWAQPANVHISHAEIFITPKMLHPEWSEESDSFHPVLYQKLVAINEFTPSVDYIWNEGTPITWRKPLANIFASQQHTSSDINASPTLLGLFTRTHDYATALAEAEPSTFYTSTGQEAPIIVQIAGYQCFVGFLMPLRETIKPKEPAWFKAL